MSRPACVEFILTERWDIADPADRTLERLQATAELGRTRERRRKNREGGRPCPDKSVFPRFYPDIPWHHSFPCSRGRELNIRDTAFV